jgi:precorrin-4/cobalt-precorrin-4 C11-methyltransferase
LGGPDHNQGNFGQYHEKVRQAGIIKTALVIVGDVLAPNKYEFSKVYDAAFTHGYRKAT